MEQLVYNNDTVAAHSLYNKCGSTLNEVSNRDYPGKDYFNKEILCLDMDIYEKNVLHSESPDCTVDAVIGISSYESSRTHNPRLLLIELRIDYKNIANLSKSEMERKVTHTKSLLSGEKAIEKGCLFIFNDSISSQAKNWFSRQERTKGILKDCSACSVSDFSTKVKSPSDFPYSPIHTEDDIKTSVLPYLSNADWTNFRREINFWCDKARSYCSKNQSEYQHIETVVKCIWSYFKSQTEHNLSDEELIENEILEEDFPFLGDSHSASA